MKKNALASKSNWFNVLVGLGPLAAYLMGVPGIPLWLVELLAFIASAGVYLRSITTEPVEFRVPKLPKFPKGPGAAALIVCMLGFSLGGCGAATCEALDWTRQPHPTLPAPAVHYILKCGDETVELDVAKPPACLDACFEAAP